MSLPSRRPTPLVPTGDRADLAVALDRAAGSRSIAGNTIEHFPDSPATLEAMLRWIAAAQQWVHLENYIIRGDHTGRRFAAALAERAGAGVRVRVLYDALGSFGTRRRYWNSLTRAGVEVRAFHPLLSPRPLDVLARDHRKLLVVDGGRAVVGGLCIGDEWAGDPRRGRQPWRDTMLAVCGPAAGVLDRAFGRVWARSGAPLPADELASDPEPCGECSVRVLAGVPGQARAYRAVQLLAAVATERLWITDAYLVAPPPLFASLLDAARGGVDVRLLVPGATDLPLIRAFTRVGYRELLASGVRIFEWQGAMLHAKTMIADRHWSRVGSSNLNVSSLLTNYELDVVAESGDLTDRLAAQFRHDLAFAQEVVLQPRRVRRAALVHVPAPQAADHPAVPPRVHKRTRYELGTVAVVAVRRVAGGIRRAMVATTALAFTVIGVLLLVFPRVMSLVIAGASFWLALGFGLYLIQRRRARDPSPLGEAEGDGG